VASESSGTWHTAIEVPGTATLNKGGQAEVQEVSCGSAGNCAAGGYYTDSANHEQAFVASESNGTWHTAIEVPGTAALNKGGNGVSAFAQVNSVSCGSAGNCAAGGGYTDAAGHVQAWVASESNGTWHTAIEVPGTAALNKGDGGVTAVSCGSAGNCAAGGSYTDAAGQQAFVASESNGTWHTAIEVPGTAALNKGGDASVGFGSVSCTSAGNCAAGGYYSVSGGANDLQAFVVSESNGTWQTAIAVPGIAALNTSGAGDPLGSLSCASAGNCAAVGPYYDDGSKAWVASESNGTWQTAIEVPGTAAFNGGFGLDSVSCGSAGNCAAGGAYLVVGRGHQAMVVNETNGTWGNAIEMPGTAALNTGGSAYVASVSCTSAGNCGAAGSYLVSGRYEVFVDSES
jgi:hypothetical protein